MSTARLAYEDNQLQGLSEQRPVALIGALLNELIISIETAFFACQHQKFSVKGEKISKAMKILNEGLIPALDYQQGGSIAQQLQDVYQFCLMTLLQASMTNDPGLMQSCLDCLRPIQEAWREVERQHPGM